MTSEQMANILGQWARAERAHSYIERCVDDSAAALAKAKPHDDLATALEAGASALWRGTCDWRWDEECWNGSCGVKWVLTDGTPAENGMLFCPRCGRHLISEQTTTPVSAGLPCNTGGEWWKAGDDS